LWSFSTSTVGENHGNGCHVAIVRTDPSQFLPAKGAGQKQSRKEQVDWGENSPQFSFLSLLSTARPAL